MLVFDDEAGRLQFGDGVILKNRTEVLPTLRSIANAEFLSDLSAQAASLEVSDRFFRDFQLRVVILGGLRHDLAQRSQLWSAARALRIVLRHLHADAPRQILDGVDKTKTGVSHEKTNGRPMSATAKAVIKLFALADSKRRRFFIVERTTCREIGARLPEPDIAIDQIDDIGPV